MSLPYPQDRARARQDNGEQPYKDAREAMARKDATIQAEAEAFGEENLREIDAERVTRLEAEAEERLREVAATRETTSANEGDGAPDSI